MSRASMKRRWPASAVLGLLALAVAWSGCARLPVAPELPNTEASLTAQAPAAQPSAAPSGLLRDLLERDSGTSDPRQWYVVKSQWVNAGTETVVQGGRYKLWFHAGSLPQSAQIRISEYHPNVLDFQLEPHGIQFGTPVDLVIDYRNTNVDPLSTNWDGTLPLFLWLNPSTSLWEIVPGLNNPLTRTYSVRLQHFSRYQLSTERAGGTAEW